VNDDESIEDEPLLVLQAGYVRRAVDRLPRQGSRDPWRVRQSYLADYRAMKRSDLVGEGLVLSHPIDAHPIDAPAAPAHQPSPATSREAT
jgi:hypothetical protein